MTNKTTVKVELIVTGINFNPNELSSYLDITPTKVAREGEIIETSKRVRSHSLWELSTKYEPSYDICNQVIKIMETINSKEDLLRSFSLNKKLDLKLGIVIRVENGEFPSIYINKELLQIFNHLRLELDFDIYYYS